MDVQCHVAAACTSFARLPVIIAHALFVFIAVTQLLQYPLSKDHRRLARKASELQVASQLARPVVSSESYRRPKPTSESMASGNHQQRVGRECLVHKHKHRHRWKQVKTGSTEAEAEAQEKRTSSFFLCLCLCLCRTFD